MAKDKILYDGAVFGELVVLGYSPLKRHKGFYICQCFCGRRVIVHKDLLLNGKRTDCGSLHKQNQISIAKPKAPGQKEENTLSSWKRVLKSCIRLGADKGFSICEEWLEFENFLRDMGDRPSRMVLIRLDESREFCRDNCRWVSRSDMYHLKNMKQRCGKSFSQKTKGAVKGI